MASLGKSRWSPDNDSVQTSLITLALYLALIAWLGIGVLPFLLLASFWANFQLTSANYIEHYGISRLRLADGRYEPCKPRHSWNSNHIVSNWALFHLQRHSDHHAHPTRPYPALRLPPPDQAPHLPWPLPFACMLALCPPLWKRAIRPYLKPWRLAA